VVRVGAPGALAHRFGVGGRRRGPCRQERRLGGAARRASPQPAPQPAAAAPAQRVGPGPEELEALAQPDGGRQHGAVLGSVEEVIAAEQLVGPLAGEKHLDAVAVREPRDHRHRDRALVHQRELVMPHRPHEPIAPRRRVHRRRPQFDPKLAGDEPRPRPLVGPGLVGHRGVVGHDPRMLLARQRSDQAGVKATRAHRPHRHVGHQAPADRPAQLRLEHVAQLTAAGVGERRHALPVDRGRRVVPAALGRGQGFEVDVEQRPGRQAVDSHKRRLRPFRPAVPDCVREHVGPCAARDPGGQQRADLRGEPHGPTVAREIERLDPEPVAREQHAAMGGVVRGEREQAVAARHRVVSPCIERVEERLGVGPAAPLSVAQLVAQLEVVEDLAVVGQPPAPAAQLHRLVAGGRRVDDGQARVYEPDLARQFDAVVVGASVRQRARHPLQCPEIGRGAGWGDTSCDAAHGGAP
jgi:hypothetical protein